MRARFYARRRLMRLPRLISIVRLRPLYLASAIFLGIGPTSLRAQEPTPPSPAQSTPPAAPQPAQPQAVHLKDYSSPRSAFPNLLQPYTPQELAPPNLGNSPRIDSLMRDGKIYLSIDDAVALALENNLDLDIARYNLNIAEADLLRAKSGASILGVNTGIVQNTPGGGRRRRYRYQRLGQFDSRHWIAHYQLRSSAHWHTPTRQERHGVSERLQPGPGRGPEHLHLELRLHPGIPVGRHTHCRIQQHSPHHQQPYQPAHSATGFEFPISFHAEPAAGFRLSGQHALYPHRQEQSRDFRRRFPSADHHHRGPDRKHVLGFGVRLRECSRAAGIPDLRPESAG